MVNAPVAFDPTFTLPRFKLLALNEICCAPPVAVPESVSWPDETPLLVCKVTLPLKAPTTVGSNDTSNVLDCPADSDKGIDKPEIENCAGVTAAELTVTALVPAFETETVCETFFPTPRLPKLRLVGLIRIEICGAFVPPELTSPAQPTSSITEASVKSTTAGQPFATTVARRVRAAVRLGDSWAPTLRTYRARFTFRARLIGASHKQYCEIFQRDVALITSSGF